MALKNELSLPDVADRVRAAFVKYGAIPMTLISPGKSGRPKEIAQRLKDFGGSEVVGELEGPNEVNNKFSPQDLNLKYDGKTDEAAGAAFMLDYNQALSAAPETIGHSLRGLQSNFTDYRLAQPCDAVDYSTCYRTRATTRRLGRLEYSALTRGVGNDVQCRACRERGSRVGTLPSSS